MLAAPVLGPLAVASANAGERAELIAAALAPPVEGMPLQAALRIDGWDAPAGAEDAACVQINASWRAAWR